MIHAHAVAQIRRWRCQADACRAIAGSRITMAHRAMLGVQRRTSGRIGGNDRCLADFIGHCQLCRELPGLTSHVGAILTLGNGVAQRIDALQQSGLLRFGRHCTDQALHGLERIELISITGLLDHPACLHRLRVIRCDVIEPMQRLWGAVHGVGQQSGAA